MKDTRPLLSILIPTYNRARCLDVNLSHLCRQLTPELEEKVEIIVSDDCSKDNTADVLEKYRSWPSVRILPNPSNLGADRNFLHTINESRGRFAWLFGDDEVMLENGLAKIVATLEENPDAGLVHIVDTGHETLEAFDFHKTHPDPQALKITDRNKFLARVGYRISFMTSHIFNRELSKGPLKPEDYAGTNLLQEIFYIQAALSAPYNLFLNDYYFSQLLNNTGSYKLFQTFATNQQRVFKDFVPYGFSPKTIASISRTMLKDFFPVFILQSRVGNFKREPIFKTLATNFWSYGFFWAFCFPLLLVPPPLRIHTLTFLRKVKRLIRRELPEPGAS